MKQYFNRYNHKFVLDSEQLKPEARSVEITNGLYSAVYEEFSGAVYNRKYKDMSVQQKLNCMNEFADNWLKARGLG